MLCFAVLAGVTRSARAQEVEANEFVPAPDGTNVVLGYYSYGHDDSFNSRNFGTIKNSGVETNIGVARYVHFDYVAGVPAGFQIYQAFGSESAGHIGTTRLGSTFGASNTVLSAFFWPYASTEKRQYLVVAGFVDPPTGSFDKTQSLNAANIFGSSGWTGELQLGWDNGLGPFSYDLGLDGRVYGDTTLPGQRIRQNPDIRLQAWANWNWTRAFQTSIGWEAIVGGKQYSNGSFNGMTSQIERIRGAASLYVASNAQLLIELNHDFSAPGGFKQSFGLITRIGYLF